MDLTNEICAIVNSHERGQTLEEIVDRFAAIIMPEIKIALDELSDEGAIRKDAGKDAGLSIYQTTYHRAD
jgi:hypothetical protein